MRYAKHVGGGGFGFVLGVVGVVGVVAGGVGGRFGVVVDDGPAVDDVVGPADGVGVGVGGGHFVAVELVSVPSRLPNTMGAVSADFTPER